MGLKIISGLTGVESKLDKDAKIIVALFCWWNNETDTKSPRRQPVQVVFYSPCFLMNNEQASTCRDISSPFTSIVPSPRSERLYCSQIDMNCVRAISVV